MKTEAKQFNIWIESKKVNENNLLMFNSADILRNILMNIIINKDKNNNVEQEIIDLSKKFINHYVDRSIYIILLSPVCFLWP